MKYINKLSLLAVAAATLAFAGVASATTVTSPSGTLYTGTFTAESSNSALHGSFITVLCTGSHFKGSVTTHGSSVTAEAPLSEWTFSGCNYATHVAKKGSLIFHATSGGNGTVTSTGAEIIVHTSVGECIFTTTGTSIGTFTGGTGAKIDIGSSVLPRTGGKAGFFCGSSGTWTGSYTVTSPGTLIVD